MSNKNIGKLTEYIIKRRKQKDDNLKYDFMPSLLEIIERPAHMASKVIIISIALLLVFAITYASLSEIDVVVTGQGQVSGSKSTLNVNATYSGKILSLNVKTGDSVKAGDVLLTLDTSEILLNKDLISYELEKAKIEREILATFYEDMNTVIDASKYDTKYTQFVDSLILENELYKKQIEGIGDEEGLYALQKKVSVNERIAELDDIIVQCENNISIYNKQLEGMTIVSPVNGYISEMLITGSGESIMANSTLMTIIPDDSRFVFEGYISDKDVGSVSVKDKVQIKLSAYSFSDYGAVYGEITEISKSSKYVEGLGNVYVVKVEFDEDLNSNITLEYGMSGNMEVLVGKRSLMDYFLEPVKQGLSNSLKEK